MDGGAWKAAVHGVAEGRTRLSDLTFFFFFFNFIFFLNLKHCISFAKHQNKSTTGIHMLPIPLPSPHHPSRSSQCTSPKHPVSCIEPGHFSLSCIGEGNGNPLQCSCLENPRDGGPWWAAIYEVVQSQTRLK